MSCSLAKPSTLSEWRTPQGVAATCEFYRAVQEDVIAWWWKHHRTDLPWRLLPSSEGEPAAAASSSAARTPLCNPYEVWVSEVMSQQTRMDTVIPYFRKWMHKFPTIEALAASSEDEVKAVWSGMGYYRRALYLHKGARYVLEWRRQHHASSSSSAVPLMPSTQQELLKVPGIGPYTSAAVASLCFGEAVCSVDGNVIRVLSRLRGEREFDPKMPANVKQACAWGQELMGNTPQTASVMCRDPSALNQGLMEIGASICRPGGAPLCSACPLQVHCCAYSLLQSGEVEAIEGVIPVRAVAAAKRIAKELCVVHEVVVNGVEGAASTGGQRRFVVVRRPSTGLLAGMLEFPTVSAASQDNDADGKKSTLQEHPLSVLPSLQGSKKRPLSVRVCGSIRHIFSHIDMAVEVLHVQWPVQAGDSQELLSAVARVVDEHHADGMDNPSPTAARISLMSEEELKSAAPSRLMLKVLHQISSSEVKRKRVLSLPKANASPRTASAKVSKKTCRVHIPVEVQGGKH